MKFVSFHVLVSAAFSERVPTFSYTGGSTHSIFDAFLDEGATCCHNGVAKLSGSSWALTSLPKGSCEVGGVVQGDQGPVCGVAQVIGYHGVTVVVGHQEEGQEEEVEKQGEVEGEKGRGKTQRGRHMDGMRME